MTSAPIEEVPPAPRFRRLFYLFGAHAIGSASITVVVATAPNVEHSLGLNHAEFGLIVAAYYGALLACALPAGLIIDRIGIGRALTLALILLSAGTFTVASANQLAQAALGLFICGMGYALVNPSTARGILLWFPTRGRATAMGVKQTGVPAGSIVAALAAAAVGGDYWRELATAIALLLFVNALFFMAFETNGSRTDSAARLADLWHLVIRTRLAYLNAASCFYAIAQAAFFTYLVLFLHETLRIETGWAGLCLAFAHTASAAGRIAWGVLADLLPSDGRRTALVGCGAASAAGMCLLAILPEIGATALPLVVAVVLGFTLGGYAGLTLTAASEITEPRLAGTSIGYNVLFTSVGTMLGPVIFGLVVDGSGYQLAWLTVCGIVAVGACIFLRMAETNGSAE